MIVSMFGRICFHKILNVLVPFTIAASTYRLRFTFKTILLARRAYFVQLTAVIAITPLRRLGPSIPAIAIARIIPGKEIIISAIRMIT